MIPAPAQTILVVSDDDVCVAPFVAAVLRTEIRPRVDVALVSAGSGAQLGAPACAFAAARVADTAAFVRYRSAPVSDELVRRADLVLVMTVAQRREVNRLVPGRQRNVFTLQEAATLALRDGVGAWSGEEPVAEFAEALHRRRGLIDAPRLAVPRRGILRRPVAVIGVDDLLDGHLLDRGTHRWALAQARSAAVRLATALRGRVVREAA